MIAAVVLAAGASTRLGTPKQLLVHRGRTLLRRAVDCAAESGCSPVFVVLGHRASDMRAALEGAAVRFVENEQWGQGLGSSVSAGVRAVRRQCPAADAVLLMVSDQPALSRSVLQALLKRFGSAGPRIVACAYGGAEGVPALFDRSLFAELCALGGSEGARSVIRNHSNDRVLIDWQPGAQDVDTPADRATRTESRDGGKGPGQGRRQ